MRCLFLVAVLCVANVGCRSEALPPASGIALNATRPVPTSRADLPLKPSVSTPDEMLELFDRRWALKGETQGSFVSLKKAWAYESEDPTVRLLVAELGKSYGVVTIAVVQVSTEDGQWINHGPERRWDDHTDGTRLYTECEYVLGEPNGVEQVWRNGNLAFRRTYVLGKEHGLSEGWYDNGKPTYKSLYSMGKEVDGFGGSWDDDGSER